VVGTLSVSFVSTIFEHYKPDSNKEQRTKNKERRKKKEQRSKKKKQEKKDIKKPHTFVYEV